MAKAINWPEAFRDEVLAEDCQALRVAFRLGHLYYDNRFWAPDEVVDIRVNHLKVRQAVVQGDLALFSLNKLPIDVLARQKSTLRSLPSVMAYLQATYNQSVDEQTEVTVVTYKNLPVDPEAIERKP